MTIAALLLSLAQDWPQFRGPDGQGHSAVTALPLAWSDASSNIRWRTPVEGLGWSSPVVAGGKIWLTAAVGGASLRAVALETASGKKLHEVELFRLPSAPPIHRKNSHASPTPILDGDRVYVHFGPYGTACLSADGKVVWKREVKYAPVHGPGGSPALVGELLIFSCDGSDVQQVVALDRKTGEIRWRTPREPLPIQKKFAFCTPLAIDVAGKTQVVLPTAGAVTSYDPANGRALWTVRYGEGYSVVPRPVFGHGLVFVGTGFDRPTLIAVRPDGRGDVTDTHVAWTLERGAPHNPSPLLVGDELYVVSDQGIATCIDARTGKVHWQERLGGAFSASPLFAAGRIYFLDENGATTVVKPGKAFEKLARNEVKGRTLASLVPLEGALLLRTDTQLLRIAAD